MLERIAGFFVFNANGEPPSNAYLMSEEITTPTEQPETKVINPEAVLAKNQELLGELAKYKKLAKQAEGFDFDKARAAMEAAEKAEEEHLVKKGEFDKILETKERLWNEKITQTEAERNEILNGFVRKELELMYLQQFDGREGYSDLAVERIIDKVEAERKDGKLDIKVKNSIGDAKDELNKLFGALREQYPALFKADITAGSGASGSGTGGQSVTTNRGSMSVAEKSAFIAKHGQDKFLQLPK